MIVIAVIVLVWFITALLTLDHAEAMQDEAQPEAQIKPTDEGPVINPNLITVHVVAHSHDDVGWLKTIDDYFYGRDNRMQVADVGKTITNVVESLLEDANRKFS